MAESNDNQKRVTIKLESVYCGDAQDRAGFYMFYVAGGAATGPLSGSTSKAILTRPREIHRNDEESLRTNDCLIFDSNVHVDDFVELGLVFRATDLDAWHGEFDDTYQASVSALTADVCSAAGSPAAPVNGSVAGAILAATPPALVRARASSDNDLVLGVVQKRVNLADYTDEFSGPFTWTFADTYPFKDEWGITWSGWDYEVRYTLDVGPVR